jgi:hypothetical protein
VILSANRLFLDNAADTSLANETRAGDDLQAIAKKQATPPAEEKKRQLLAARSA